MAATAPVYHPREPTDSTLWKILHHHYEDFRAGYDERCEKQYGSFRPVVDEVVEEYLRCGDLHEGFARVRCTNPECKHEYLLAFSCKGRWFCPSCHAKKTIQFAEDATNNILYPVPHRQFVFSIPIMLRIYFKYDRRLLTRLCHCARDSLEIFFRTVLGLDDGILGMILVIHTFGDYARFHPHLHAIVADGLFRPNGTFYCLPKKDLRELEEIFRSKVLAMLKREGKINQELIEKLMNWRHSGFSVHAGNRIGRDDCDGQKALAEYILRNAFSEQKITYLEDTGKVLYRSAMTHGNNKKNFEIFTAEEFIAAITQHIPDKHFQMVRYYGWYSNRSRGDRIKKGVLRPGDEPPQAGNANEVTVLDVSDYQPARIPAKTWRDLIKKIWEVDPLTCPRCGHDMKIISLIHEPAVIERILRHLGLWKQQTAPSGRRATAPEHGPVVSEDFDDGWPGYEEPAFVYH